MLSPRRAGRGPLARLVAHVLIAAFVVTLLPAPAQAALPSVPGVRAALPDLPLSDSVPAVLGVTDEAFIVYTSNIFAIVGLRSLYFVVAAGLKGLKYLKPALILLLAFIGAKMVVAGPWSDWYHMPVSVSLAVVAGILGVAIAASIVHARRHPAGPAGPAARAQDAPAAPAGGSGKDL